MMEISAVLKEVVDWEELAGWLGIGTGDIHEIRSYCNMASDKPSHCYRKRLVKVYHESTAKSPREIAEDFAWFLEHKMRNKMIALRLQQLSFSEL